MSVVVACPEFPEPASHTFAPLLALAFPLPKTRFSILFLFLFLAYLKGILVLLRLAQQGFTKDELDYLLSDSASPADYELEYPL